MAKLLVLGLVSSFLCAAHAVSNFMSCTSWSGAGLCNLDPKTKNIASIGCFNGTIGGLSGNSHWYHGVFTADIKFPKASTEGTITAFYLIDTESTSNKDANHFEIDIEFYGARDPKAIVMATNVFFAGKQNLAQFSLPFDPSAAFHTYSMVWNANGIIWLVDNKPVRVLRLLADKPWPRQPLLPMFTVWPVNWGDVKPDYSKGPIFSAVRNINFQGCPFNSSDSGSDPCPSRTGFQLPWNKPLVPQQLVGLKPTAYGLVSKTSLLNDWGWDGA